MKFFAKTLCKKILSSKNILQNIRSIPEIEAPATREYKEGPNHKYLLYTILFHIYAKGCFHEYHKNKYPKNVGTNKHSRTTIKSSQKHVKLWDEITFEFQRLKKNIQKYFIENFLLSILSKKATGLTFYL